MSPVWNVDRVEDLDTKLLERRRENARALAIGYCILGIDQNDHGFNR